MKNKTLRLFWAVTWKYKWLLLVSEIGLLLFTLCSEILLPFVVSKAIDKLTQNPLDSLSMNDFTQYLWAFASLQVGYLVFGRLNMQTYIRLEPAGVRDLENIAFNKLQHHSLGFFADNFSGALVAKVTRLTGSYQRFTETVLQDFTYLLFRYIPVLIILIYLSKLIALAFVLWTIFFCISIVYLHRRKITHSKAAAAAQTVLTARLADIITNTLTIRSFSRTDEEGKEFRKLSSNRFALRLRTSIIGEWIRLYKGVCMVVLEFGTLYLSIQYALQGTLSIGAIVLIQVYLFQLLMQLWNFGRVIDRIEEAIADAAEMTEIINLPISVNDPTHPENPRMQEGTIEFKNVNFRYHGSDDDVHFLKQFNLLIPAGQKVGLVGPSGSGKTTLTKLLLRFMDVSGGEIHIDGQNITHVTQEDLRQAIAYVPQEPLLFHRTIRENIAYSRPKASLEEIIATAKQAHADEFIQTLPQKYETLVGERGVKLSGGQRQRVAIARAMIKKAPILVLDEATSSLDSVSEKLITQALDLLMEKRTTIVIAHRLSTIRKLDRILVLDEGKIVEDGNHEELLAQNGLYARLWSHQSGDFIGED